MSDIGHTNEELTNQTVELLQSLIRNECVNTGAVESGVRFFDSPSCHHRPEIYGGLSAAAAAAQLKAFFKQRR